MKVLIVEDEGHAARKLTAMLESLNPTIEVAAVAGSISEAGEALRKHHFDLGFLDIELSDGSVFSLLENKALSFPVIFVTAYEQHALRAFKHNSIDYLLKPLQRKELQEALQRYERLWRPAGRQGQQLIRQLAGMPTEQYKERFTVSIRDRIKIIPTHDIVCFYSYRKGTFIFTRDERNYLISYPLDEVMQLVDPGGYFRVSRKFIVNIKAITSIVRYSGSRLRLHLQPAPDEEVFVSRERVKDFKRWIEGN